MSDRQKHPARLSDFDDPVILTGLKQVWQNRTVLDISELRLILCLRRERGKRFPSGTWTALLS